MFGLELLTNKPQNLSTSFTLRSAKPLILRDPRQICAGTINRQTRKTQIAGRKSYRNEKNSLFTHLKAVSLKKEKPD